MLSKIDLILERLENGETLTKICKGKDYPSLSVVYRACRQDDELHNKIMKARQNGTFTILDKIHDELNEKQDPKYFQQYREKAHHARWLASKLAAGTFGDKIKQEVKQDTTITFSWGKPKQELEAEVLNEAIKKPQEPISVPGVNKD